jgi:hypothetical protein
MRGAPGPSRPGSPSVILLRREHPFGKIPPKESV